MENDSKPKQIDLFTGKPARKLRSARAGTEGYAARPGTGPAGMTCGHCVHFTRTCEKWFKCALVPRAGQKTDIKKSMPACALFAPVVASAEPAAN